MKNLEKCASKLDIETGTLSIILKEVDETCISCDGYNTKCSKYTVIKEDYYGL